MSSVKLLTCGRMTPDLREGPAIITVETMLDDYQDTLRRNLEAARARFDVARVGQDMDEYRAALRGYELALSAFARAVLDGETQAAAGGRNA
jgi:hypothetical protein